MDVLSWDERSVLTDRGFLPSVVYDRLDAPGDAVDLVDRYRGAFVGLAVGDALGKPIEGLDPEVVASRYGRVNRYLSSPFPQLLLPPGQVSDDTQLAIAAASGAISKGRLEPADLAQRLMAWLPIARRAGDAVSNATRSLRNGMPWTNTGQPSSGNGALTRSVAVALMSPFDLDGLRTNSALQTVITHADHSAIAASVATAATVSHLLATPPGQFRPEGLLRAVERALSEVTDPSVRLRNRSKMATVWDCVRAAVESTHLTAPEAYATFGTGGFALESLPIALWAFAAHPDNPVASVILAVNGGSASSTNGALAGAFAGAYNGVSSLPDAWIDHLEYADGVAGHADGLLALAGVGAAVEPFRSFDVLRPDTYAPFSLGGSIMPTLEHAIRSSAAPDPTQAVKVRLVPTPADARRYAVLSPSRSDWPAAASGTVGAILRRRFGGQDPASIRLQKAGDPDIEQAAALFAGEPFDYAALLAERRAAMTQT